MDEAKVEVLEDTVSVGVDGEDLERPGFLALEVCGKDMVLVDELVDFYGCYTFRFD